MTQQNTQKSKTWFGDLAFYGSVGALGVTLTTLCYYGYKYYQNKTEYDPDLIMELHDLTYTDYKCDDTNCECNNNFCESDTLDDNF